MPFISFNIKILFIRCSEKSTNNPCENIAVWDWIFSRNDLIRKVFAGSKMEQGWRVLSLGTKRLSSARDTYQHQAYLISSIFTVTHTAAQRLYWTVVWKGLRFCASNICVMCVRYRITHAALTVRHFAALPMRHFAALPMHIPESRTKCWQEKLNGPVLCISMDCWCPTGSGVPYALFDWWSFHILCSSSSNWARSNFRAGNNASNWIEPMSITATVTTAEK